MERGCARGQTPGLQQTEEEGNYRSSPFLSDPHEEHSCILWTMFCQWHKHKIISIIYLKWILEFQLITFDLELKQSSHFNQIIEPIWYQLIILVIFQAYMAKKKIKKFTVSSSSNVNILFFSVFYESKVNICQFRNTGRTKRDISRCHHGLWELVTSI